MSKRVWVLVPGTGGGGAEFVATEWANWLASNGYELAVLVTSNQTRGRLDASIPIIPLGGRGFLGRTRSLRKLIRQSPPDVIIAMMPHWNVLALTSMLGLRLSKPRVVISGRNVESSLIAVQGLRFKMETALARLLYRGADAYVAISHPVAAEAIVKYRLRPDRVWVVPNPASAKVPKPHDVGAHTRPAESPGHALRLIVPARIVPQKRPMLAIDIAAVLNSRGARTSVHFFGTGPMEREVASYASSVAVQVEFHGWQEQWFDSASSGDVVLLPSLAEGFANVLVEAAAVGVPSVVGSRALGSADALLPGITGYFAQEDSSEGFADAVERARDLRLVGIDRWLAYFSPAESGNAIARVVEGGASRGDQYQS